LTTCFWCWKEHREGTKVKAKHEAILRKIVEGKVPCELGKCIPHLCSHLVEIYVSSMNGLETNCNHLLADINSIRHNLKVLKEKVKP